MNDLTCLPLGLLYHKELIKFKKEEGKIGIKYLNGVFCLV